MRQTKAYSPAPSYLVSQKTSTRIYILGTLSCNICEDDDNRLVVTINYEGDGEVVVMFNLNVLSDDLVF